MSKIRLLNIFLMFFLVSGLLICISFIGNSRSAYKIINNVAEQKSVQEYLKCKYWVYDANNHNKIIRKQTVYMLHNCTAGFPSSNGLYFELIIGESSISR